jgi:hypothetical protein
VVTGTPAPGHVLHAAFAHGSAVAARVAYRWQVCATRAGTKCSAIPGATASTLRVTKKLSGRIVRVVTTATASGTRLTSTSKAVAIRKR